MAEQVDLTSTQTAARAGGEPQSAGSLLYRLLGLIRFSHTLFALPFALLACAFAVAVPTEYRLSPGALGLRLIAVVACMVFARSAAMAFNRLVDAKWDAANPRTKSRHLPTGQLKPGWVWIFFSACCLAFAAACLLFLPNWLPIALALPVLLWICGYSYAKRFTAAAHVWLGVALALSPVCAWIGIRGEQVIADPIDILPAIGLAVAIALWVTGFDIIYACQDAEFDRRIGLHSIPARLGIGGALNLSSGLHGAMLIALVLLPWFAPVLSLGWLYFAALAVVAVLIVRQHAILSPTDLQRVNIAFFHINAMISLGLSAAAAVDTWLR